MDLWTGKFPITIPIVMGLYKSYWKIYKAVQTDKKVLSFNKKKQYTQINLTK